MTANQTVMRQWTGKSLSLWDLGENCFFFGFRQLVFLLCSSTKWVITLYRDGNEGWIFETCVIFRLVTELLSMDKYLTKHCLIWKIKKFWLRNSTPSRNRRDAWGVSISSILQRCWIANPATKMEMRKTTARKNAQFAECLRDFYCHLACLHLLSSPQDLLAIDGVQVCGVIGSSLAPRPTTTTSRSVSRRSWSSARLLVSSKPPRRSPRFELYVLLFIIIYLYIYLCSTHIV